MPPFRTPTDCGIVRTGIFGIPKKARQGHLANVFASFQRRAEPGAATGGPKGVQGRVRRTGAAGASRRIAFLEGWMSGPFIAGGLFVESCAKTACISPNAAFTFKSSICRGGFPCILRRLNQYPDASAFAPRLRPRRASKSVFRVPRPLDPPLTNARRAPPRQPPEASLFPVRHSPPFSDGPETGPSPRQRGSAAAPRCFNNRAAT